MNNIALAAAADVMAMAGNNVKLQADMAMLKASMVNSEGTAQQLLDTFTESNRSVQRSAQPHLGAKIDVKI